MSARDKQSNNEVAQQLVGQVICKSVVQIQVEESSNENIEMSSDESVKLSSNLLIPEKESKVKERSPPRKGSSQQ